MSRVMGVLVCVSLVLGLASPSFGYVHKPFHATMEFEHEEVKVVARLFCLSQRDCPTESEQESFSPIFYRALAAWNNIGAFHLHLYPVAPLESHMDRPCDIRGAVVLIINDNVEACPDDTHMRRPSSYMGGVEVSNRENNTSRIYLYLSGDDTNFPSLFETFEEQLSRLLVHELGHVLGLDHPDEHGQEVAAIMNSYGHGVWDKPQRDDIEGIHALYGGSFESAANFETPTHNANYSGIGVIAGWKCDVNGDLTVRFNDGPAIPLLYGAYRPDTASECGDDNNGFLTIWNWGELGDGTHTAVVYDDGVEFGRSTFQVVTTGEAFLRGAVGSVWVEDFPSPGERTLLDWNQSTQHFEILRVE